MGFTDNGGFDWNGNGKSDAFDNYMNMKVNVERFVDIANKYTDLRELTPEVLRTFIERIIIHERTAKHSKTATQQIDIYFRYIGKLAPEAVA